MTTWSRVGAWAVLVLIGAPVAAAAQAGDEREVGRPLLVGGVVFRDPRLGTAGEVGVLIPWKTHFCCEQVFDACQCVEASVRLGDGGGRFAIGPAAVEMARPLVVFALDALLTVERTSDSPRRAIPRSTYVGAEGGITIATVRLGLGVAHRVTDPGPHETVFTWNIGLRVAW